MLVLVAMQLQGVPEKVTTLGYWVTFLGHPVQALGQGLLQRFEIDLEIETFKAHLEMTWTRAL